MRTRSDSTRPWSPQEIEVGMADVSEQIEDGVAVLKSLGEEAAHRKYEYELREAQLLLEAAASHPELKTEALRKAWVHTQVADLKLAATIAEHLVKTQAKANAALETQADLLRSAGRSHRDMTEGAGWGGRPQPSTRHREQEFG